MDARRTARAAGRARSGEDEEDDDQASGEGTASEEDKFEEELVRAYWAGIN